MTTTHTVAALTVEAKGVHPDRLAELLGRHVGVLAQQHSGETAYGSRGLRGARASEEVVADSSPRGFRVDGGAGDTVGGDRPARSDQVGEPLVVATSGPGRDVSTPTPDDGVVGAGVDGADRHDQRIDCRRVEVLLVLAAIARRDDHEDAGVPGPLDGGREHVAAVRVDPGLAEREVEHSDVEAVAVAVVDDPVDGGDHLRNGRDPVVAGDLQADDPGVGGDALVTRTGAGDDAGHVGAVAVGVEECHLSVARLH